MATALACDTPVEDLSRRSATGQVFANPDGTFTGEVTAQPRFARSGTGSWSPIDLTLTTGADGGVVPRLAPRTMALSAGGAQTPLMSVGGVSLSWPGTLPTPTLAGPSAIYSEVLPGVDLRVTVTVDGLSEVLVVKSRTAATNPTLSTLLFPMSAPGMTVSVDASHGLRVSDGSSVVMSGGVPAMWDSTSDTGAAAAQDEAAGDAPFSDASGPDRLAKVAQLPVAYSGGVLSVQPDPGMFTDADTHYPVYVDPSIGTTAWTMINNNKDEQSYWSYDRNDCPDAFSGNQCAKVGYTDDPKPAMTYRSLFDFSTSLFSGTHVLDATLSMDELHSWTCSNTTTDVQVVNDVIGSGTNWNNDASKWTGTTVASVSNSDCHDARVYTGFTGALLNAAVTSAAGGAARLTLGVKAGNESNHDGWKKFDAATAKLSVNFNSYPNTPDTLTVDGKACGTGANAPHVSTLGGHNPVLQARLSDPDSADHLTGTFTWSTATGSSTGSQANIANGQYAQVTTSAAVLTDGATYRFTVTSSDGRDSSRSASAPCDFVVDATAPSAVPSVVSADGRFALSRCDGSSGWCDGVGKAGSFAFGANGVTDVAGYRYGFTSPPTSSVDTAAAGGTATVSLTPTGVGLTDLYVRSVDAAGNLGPIADYRFFVASGAPPIGLWSFNEGTGTAAADTGTNVAGVPSGHPMTLAGGATWAGGRVLGGNAGTFNGTTAYSQTTGPVVHSNQSFSVAAWVRLTNTTPWGTITAQAGVHQSGVLLQHVAGGGWALAVQQTDTNAPAQVRAIATQPAVAGVWTHLVGVYDATAGQIRIYVNGQQGGSAAATITWDATGPLNIGREFHDDAFGSYFPGDIDAVHAYQGVLSTTDIQTLANS